MLKEEPPFISCIVTVFSEGIMASTAIESILAQSFLDFELIIVDDGATEETRHLVQSYTDSRIVYIRQSNDGLSSARNRGISVARGEYICFLDADDSRPVWAFAEMARIARSTNVDAVFSPGILRELRKEALPFYDDAIFRRMIATGLENGELGRETFLPGLRLLAAIEPQSANKLVKRELIMDGKLRFPSGLFFEDIVFHNALILMLRSYAVSGMPCFTYYRHYARPQITSTVGLMRFDAISSAANALGLFARSEHFQDVVMRLLVLASTFKLLRWCEESVSHHIRWQFRQMLLVMVAGLDGRYSYMPQGPEYEEAIASAPWVRSSLDYFHSQIKR